MDRDEFVDFVRDRGLAVVASTGPKGTPQAALVGVAATDLGELVFDTTDSSRKYANIAREPEVAVVVGWDDEVTVQCEGRADILEGDELERCRAFYFEQYPDGRERASWPGIAYIRIRPRWLRYSDYRPDSFGVSETEL
jgi:pyridoxine/pyridoxamine 5'-phosphate oxidase